MITDSDLDQLDLSERVWLVLQQFSAPVGPRYAAVESALWNWILADADRQANTLDKLKDYECTAALEQFYDCIDELWCTEAEGAIRNLLDQTAVTVSNSAYPVDQREAMVRDLCFTLRASYTFTFFEDGPLRDLEALAHSRPFKGSMLANLLKTYADIRLKPIWLQHKRAATDILASRGPRWGLIDVTGRLGVVRGPN